MFSWSRLLPYPFSLFLDVSGDGRKYALLPPIISPPHNQLHFALSPLTSYGHARRALVHQFVSAESLVRTRIQLSHNAATNNFGDVICQFDLPAAAAAPVGRLALRVTPMGTAATFAQVKLTSAPPQAVVHAAHTLALTDGVTAGAFARGDVARLLSASASAPAAIPAAEKYDYNDQASDAVVGVRLDDADSSAGVDVSVAGGASAWFASSYPPRAVHKSVAAGVSVSVDTRSPMNSASVDASVYYRPALTAPIVADDDVSGPVSEFGLEMIDNGAAVIASYYHHSIVRRRVYNPLESAGVVAIHNYIDLGAEYIVSKAAAASASWQFVGAWQMNKNVMIKARVSDADAAAAVVLKSWWSPSVTAALTVVRGFVPSDRQTRIGIALDVCDVNDAIFGRPTGTRVQTHSAVAQNRRYRQCAQRSRLLNGKIRRRNVRLWRRRRRRRLLFVYEFAQ